MSLSKKQRLFLQCKEGVLYPSEENTLQFSLNLSIRILSSVATVEMENMFI